MRQDDLFRDPSPSGDPLGGRSVLRTEFLEKVRIGPVAEFEDLEIAIALTHLVHDNLTLFGTSGDPTLTEQEMSVALRTLKALLARLGIEHQIEWRNYATFKSYWLRNNAHGSWQARRDLLNQVFLPISDELELLEDSLLSGNLAEAVSPTSSTGWPKVDEEIRELRRRFRTATTPQDYRSVGTHCVGVLEALSRTVYEPATHLRSGEDEPPVDKTKQRLGRYVEDAVPGSDNALIRGVLNRTIELAHSVKHRETPNRRDAGVAADAVILLANILRRLRDSV